MRLKGLDFLRGIAILGVLFRHLEIDTWIAGPGGYGVDLFFVLSGFLVSGLLFSEYQREGKIQPGRFLIRRGFKIYPSFYFFILLTILIFALFYGNYFPRAEILSEVFFLQSYLTPMWMHTWSLAVEEHFYISLAIIIFFAAKFDWIRKAGVMIGIFVAFILVALTLRFIHVHDVHLKNHEVFFYTHLRMDGLFTGALLGYLWHFRKKFLAPVYIRKKFFTFMVFALALPALILRPNNTFMLTFGFNLFHIACALAIILMLESEGEKTKQEKGLLSKLKTFIAFIGVYSYTIYLWHLPVKNILLRYIPNLFVESVIYILTSLLVGIGMSLLIEKPMLRIREKYFPVK
jgi:peptidoglycan/LPS O-acetylase OafA/YrhL